jgi:hypothetical protein
MHFWGNSVICIIGTHCEIWILVVHGLVSYKGECLALPLIMPVDLGAMVGILMRMLISTIRLQ